MPLKVDERAGALGFMGKAIWDYGFLTVWASTGQSRGHADQGPWKHDDVVACGKMESAIIKTAMMKRRYQTAKQFNPDATKQRRNKTSAKTCCQGITKQNRAHVQIAKAELEKRSWLTMMNLAARCRTMQNPNLIQSILGGAAASLVSSWACCFRQGPGSYIESMIFRDKRRM